MDEKLKLSRVRQALARLASVRLPLAARDLLREAIGVLDDDTALGIPGKRELEAIDGLAGDSK